MRKSRLFISIAAGLMTLTALASNTTPVHRPLIEEYTGTWCGWCVRGLVGMELLRETYGDDFIGVAYHNGDPMQIMGSNKYPNSVSGFPDAYIDRTSEVDPYYGFGSAQAGILTAMQQFAAIEAIAGIDVTAKWADADRTAIDVNVTSYFTQDDNNAKYAIEIMIIADDLYGTASNWSQNNYYSGTSGYSNDPYLSPWVQKPTSVSGIHFNDVLAYTTGVISGSLPSSLTAYNDYTYSRTIALSSVKPGMIQNKDNLHIIAIVVNTGTKKAINANRCYISDFVVSIPGDVNDDNIVNIEDVTVLIDYLLSGGTNTINTVNADVNSDERISIDDVTALIDLLLNNAN